MKQEVHETVKMFEGQDRLYPSKNKWFMIKDDPEDMNEQRINIVDDCGNHIVTVYGMPEIASYICLLHNYRFRILSWLKEHVL